MPSVQYNNMLSDYVTTSDAVLIPDDPTLKLQNRLATLLRKKDFPSCWYCKPLPNPACPPLYAFIKTHKNPISICPMVDKTLSPLTPLERKLAKWCNRILSSYHLTVSSSAQFIQRLSSYTLNDDDTMVVADFVSLFPSILIQPACICLYRFLLEHTSGLNVSPATLRDVSHLLLYNSFFFYGDRFYRQTRGVPIGGPMAGVIAELVVRRCEQQVASALHNNVRFFSRYVDDLFFIYNGTSNVDFILDLFNNQPLDCALV